MTAFNNAPSGAEIVQFPVGRVRRLAMPDGEKSAVLDLWQARAANTVDVSGFYHQAAIDEERVRRQRGNH